MKPTFIIKNKKEWMRLSKGIINIPYPNREEMWDLSKPYRTSNDYSVSIMSLYFHIHM